MSPPRVREPAARRRGIAVLLVLLLLSITLGLSYAAMRGQGTAFIVRRNAERRLSARQVAITGLTMAIKKMQTGAWGGVDTTLTGQFSTYEYFQASYTTGDPTLTTASADYADYPFRVTVLCTGFAADPNNPQCVATHKVRAVLRLNPRQLGSEPSNWSDVLAHPIYQQNTGTFAIDVPCRLEGRVKVQNMLLLGYGLNWADNVRTQYFSDLNQMRSHGFADWRPFSGPVDLPYWWQWFGAVSMLNSTLGVSTNDVSARTISYPTDSWLPLTYRLYTGGKVYNVPSIASTQQATSLGPDPLTNPAGIFYCPSILSVRDDVTIRGTVITSRSAAGDVNLYGKRIRWDAVTLPGLDGASQGVQLPAIMSGDDVFVNDGAEATINGMVACYDTFQVASVDQNRISLTVNGGLAATTISIPVRSNWNYTSTWWDNRYNEFRAQQSLPAGLKYFPDWLSRAYGLSPTPKLSFLLPAAVPRYHWHSGNNPIYVAHPNDPGLRWDLLDWTEKL